MISCLARGNIVERERVMPHCTTKMNRGNPNGSDRFIKAISQKSDRVTVE